jgi:hypothetical protein
MTMHSGAPPCSLQAWPDQAKGIVLPHRRKRSLPGLVTLSAGPSQPTAALCSWPVAAPWPFWSAAGCSTQDLNNQIQYP